MAKPFPRLLAVFIVLLLPSLVYGQEVPDLSVADLAASADSIVIGSVSGVQSMWSDPRHLVTVVTIAVTETLKGTAAPQISVVVPGGIDANRPIPIAMTYPGAPSFGAGEKVFLFLANDPDLADSQSVAGFSAGKFSIVEDAAGQQFVSRDDIRVLNVPAPAGLQIGTRQLTPIAEFKEAVTGALSALRSEGAGR